MVNGMPSSCSNSACCGRGYRTRLVSLYICYFLHDPEGIQAKCGARGSTLRSPVEATTLGPKGSETKMSGLENGLAW